MPVISVTRLRLKSRWFLPTFVFYALRSSHQAQQAQGFICGWVGRDSEWAFWTTTVWHSTDALMAFRNSGAHRSAMPRLLHWCDEAAFVHWDQAGTQTPDAATAHDRLTRHGKLSKVAAPSSRQQAGATAGAVTPRMDRELLPRTKSS